jgi:hypothetical protein
LAYFLADANIPRFKCFVQWDGGRHHHVVYYDELTPQEENIITEVSWPTRQEICRALSATTYGALDVLVGANDDIRTLLQSREVE